MPTAPGTLVRNSANRITLVFVVDGIQYSFTGTISPALPPFTSDEATLTYDTEDQLTGTNTFSGRIGSTPFKFTFGTSGPTVEGNLNAPGIATANTVDGSGVWEQS